MTTPGRIVFSGDFVHAIQVRGLTVRKLAKLSGVSTVTISSALQGRRVNISTALALSRTVAGVPVVDELSQWVASAKASDEAA